MHKNILNRDKVCQDLERRPTTPQRYPQDLAVGRGPAEKDERSESLLYLYSNNGDEKLKSSDLFSPYHKKQAEVIYQNVERFIKKIGIKNVGFLTLTFPDNVKCHKEAARRFKNMNRRLLSVLFGKEWLCVKELQIRGAWHFHLLVNCKKDIRSGLNWDEIHPPKGKRPKYSSASPYLRSLWKELRESLPKYQFGRSELLPIRSTAEGCGRYMGKYLSKHNLSKVMSGKKDQYKGMRLFSSSKNTLTSTTKFQWNTDGAKEWRRKLQKFCEMVGISKEEDILSVFGSKWAYNLKEYIIMVDTLTPPEIKRIAGVYCVKYEESKHMENVKYNSKYRRPPEVVGHELINTSTGEVLF